MSVSRSLLKPEAHSSAWVFQCWASFILSVSATGLGIAYLPMDAWVKGYLGMGLTFTVGATFNVAKTTRDIHEAQKLTARVDEARVEKLLAEQHPLK
jgi:hypothetical protein